VLYECLLKRIKVVSIRKTFDCLNLSPVGPDRQIAARVDGLAVQQHRARSTFASVTTDLRAR